MVFPSRAKLHEVIFEADTPAGKAFDVALLVLIVASVVAVKASDVLSVVDPVRAGTIFEAVPTGRLTAIVRVMEEAVEIAKGCPTFELDGTVEVREVMPM